MTESKPTEKSSNREDFSMSLEAKIPREPKLSGDRLML